MMSTPRVDALCREAASERGFYVASVLLFVASVMATLAWCQAMPMPGMPTCGQTAWGRAVSFIGMWTVMMVAMMLPSLVPLLGRYRRALAPMGERRLACHTALAAAGYFGVWSAVGVLAWATTEFVQAPELHSRVETGLLVLAAGAFQFTPWKRRALERCRPVPASAHAPSARGAWRYGMRLGVHCCSACAGLMVIPLAVGMMDWMVMLCVALAITLERLWQGGLGMTRAVGWCVMTAGVWLLVQG